MIPAQILNLSDGGLALRLLDQASLHGSVSIRFAIPNAERTLIIAVAVLLLVTSTDLWNEVLWHGRRNQGCLQGMALFDGFVLTPHSSPHKMTVHLSGSPSSLAYLRARFGFDLAGSQGSMVAHTIIFRFTCWHGLAGFWREALFDGEQQETAAV